MRRLRSVVVVLPALAGALMLPAVGSATIVPTACELRPDVNPTISVFGYVNTGTTTAIAYGVGNTMAPAPATEAGQPTTFLPGSYGDVFQRQSAIARPLITQALWTVQGLGADGIGTPCAGGPGIAASDGPPSISDATPAVGDTLTATSSWSGTPAPTVRYRWERCRDDACRPVDMTTLLATGSTSYVVSAADVGWALRVRAVAAASTGIATALSTRTATVTGSAGAAAPAVDAHYDSGSTSAPVVVGDVLAPPADAWSWSGTPAPTLSYRWQRCTPACADIAGATSALLPLTVQLAGTSVRVVATAQNASGTADYVSQELTAPTVAASAAPVPLAPPSIAGSAGSGRTLTADPGSWPASPAATIAYRWQRCTTTCADVPGATTASYDVTDADAGDRLRVVVTASNATGVRSAASEPTAVAEASATASTAPQIAGQPDVGATLSVADPGAWSAAGLTYAYQWQRCTTVGCADIAGAVQSSYVVASADGGASLQVVVRGDDAALGVPATSNRIGPAGPVRLVSPPQLAGASASGGTATTSPGTWIGTPAPAVAFQWLRCDAAGAGCVELEGAGGAAYNLVPADAGHRLRVRVTASNGFSEASATTAAGPVVQLAAGPLPSPVAIRSVRAVPNRFRVAPGRTALAAGTPRGTRFALDLSGPAFVRIDLARARTGMRAGGRCRAAGAAAVRGRRCTTWGMVAVLTRSAPAGASRIAFSGRIGRAPLAPGRYRATFVAVGADGGVSAPRLARFTVVR